MTWASIDFALAVAAVPLLLAAAYLALLAALSRGSAAPLALPPRLRFDVIVPAHDEQRMVGATVTSLRALDYPKDLYRVWVVADNCQDRTAAVARSAGGRVLVREDPERRGKGQALAWAFDRLLGDAFADAFVVVDADSLVSGNLLSAFAARLAGGAHALQARYGVRNPDASWRTRLMTVAFALSHGVRFQARERLGLSCGLRGNGMAFSRTLLQAMPWRAFSLVEDVEYGIHLALAGHRVRYVAEALALAEMVSSERPSRSQRRRWEDGRHDLRRRYLRTLVRQALARRSAVLLDLAVDLLVPPLTTLAAWSGFGLVGLLIAIAFGARLIIAPAVLGLASLALLTYAARGWRMAGTRLVDVLLWVPVFMCWKLGLRLIRRPAAAHEWVRTERESGP